jgi:hypothetical protein
VRLYPAPLGISPTDCGRVRLDVVTGDVPTRLWTLRREDEEILCQVRLEAYGIEVDLVRGGKIVLTRVFETDGEALAWADAKRATREADGWTFVPPNPAEPQRPVA